jgi:hypothetical protein
MTEEYPEDIKNDIVIDEDDDAEPAPEDGDAPTLEDIKKLINE